MSIFISHSSQDDVFVNKLSNELQLRGYHIWVDHYDIPAGNKWAEVVEAALHQSQVMLMVISTPALSSYHVKVEWQAFLDLQRPIYPILIEQAELPLLLRSFHYLDFSDMSQFEQNLERLLISLPAPEYVSDTDDSEEEFNDVGTVVLVGSTMNHMLHLAEIRSQAQSVARNFARRLPSDEIRLILPQVGVVLDYKLDRPLVIGRTYTEEDIVPDIDLSSFDSENSISRRHAMIALKDGQLRLVDLSSSNGTFIENKRLKPKLSYEVHSGALIRLSETFAVQIQWG